eukprot:5803515-Pleurochrysis_carterae.AAC.4
MKGERLVDQPEAATRRRVPPEAKVHVLLQAQPQALPGAYHQNSATNQRGETQRGEASLREEGNAVDRIDQKERKNMSRRAGAGAGLCSTSISLGAAGGVHLAQDYFETARLLLREGEDALRSGAPVAVADGVEQADEGLRLEAANTMSD